MVSYVLRFKCCQKLLYNHASHLFVLFSPFLLTASYDALGDKTQDKDITSLIFSNKDK